MHGEPLYPPRHNSAQAHSTQTCAACADHLPTWHTTSWHPSMPTNEHVSTKRASVSARAPRSAADEPRPTMGDGTRQASRYAVHRSRSWRWSVGVITNGRSMCADRARPAHTPVLANSQLCRLKVWDRVRPCGPPRPPRPQVCAIGKARGRGFETRPSVDPRSHQPLAIDSETPSLKFRALWTAFSEEISLAPAPGERI